jgi:23S rRNA (guanosine2251-2'-O)-methyltransferase
MSDSRRVWGIHAAETALAQAPEKVRKAWVDRQAMQGRLRPIAARIEALGVEIVPLERRQLDRLGDARKHQGVILELDLPPERDEVDLLRALDAAEDSSLYLVLDQVQDPHNLGACLRTADAAGVSGVVLTRDRTVGLTPTVAKVASGAAETVPIFRVTNLARTLELFKEKGFWVVGAASEAQRSLYEADFTVPLVLVMGSEGTGLRHLTKQRCDYLVRIPMLGSIESLNLSVATGVVLYEAVRQRRFGQA